MGFDYRKIFTITRALKAQRYELFGGRVPDIEVIADRCRSFEEVYDAYNCALVPPANWKGHIEYEPRCGEEGGREAGRPCPCGQMTGQPGAHARGWSDAESCDMARHFLLQCSLSSLLIGSVN